MKKSVKKKPKVKVFSVSFSEDDLAEVERFLADMKSEMGFSPSRNNWIRQTCVAATRYARERKKNPKVSFDEIFKAVE